MSFNKSFKKENIEERAYEVIDDICNEFDITLQKYPKVYWIGKEGTPFEKLSLKKIYEKDYKDAKFRKSSMYLKIPNMILIGANNIIDLSEECGHCIHFTASNATYKNKNAQDSYALSIITEMLGYFSSKLYAPKRKIGVFNEYPDAYGMSNDERKKLKNDINNKYKGFSFSEFYIYQQGYSLGECLYNNYISDFVKPEYIKKLFLQSHEEKNSATETFLLLKENMYLKNSKIESLKLK